MPRTGKKAIRDAIMDVLKMRIDRGNYGMLSRYEASNANRRILQENHIQINNNTVTQDGIPIYHVKRRYATRKTNGFHRELTPTLEALEPPTERTGRQRLYVDMDGTLSVFTPVDTHEYLYQEGFFRDAQPQENVVEAVRDIIQNHPEIEVYILSAYLTDSEFALNEKNEWLNRYLPEIDVEHRIFVPNGSDKKEYVPGGLRTNDFLLDDYTVNLNQWQPPARGIKLLNAINHTRGTWEHDRIRYDRTPQELAQGIVAVMQNGERIIDPRIERAADLPHTFSVVKSVDDVVWGGGLAQRYTAIDEDGVVAGVLTFQSDNNDTPHISFIQTEEAYKRQGVATLLLQELQRDVYPTEIQFGMTTPDGTELLNAITETRENPSGRAAKEEFTALQDELNALQTRLDALYQIDEPDPQTADEIYTTGERWQQIYDEIRMIESNLDVDDLKASYRYVTLPEWEAERQAERGGEALRTFLELDRFTDDELETELDARDDTAVEGTRNPELAGYYDRTIRAALLVRENTLAQLTEFRDGLEQGQRATPWSMRHYANDKRTLHLAIEMAQQREQAKERSAQMPVLDNYPIRQAAVLDYIDNPERTGTGGVYRASTLFRGMVEHLAQEPEAQTGDSTELYRQYDREWTVQNLRNAGRGYSIFHENEGRYELVYQTTLNTLPQGEQQELAEAEQIYARFNDGTSHPADYYGVSLMTGDIVVFHEDFSFTQDDFHAYRVDSFGFSRADELINEGMRARIKNGITVRQEAEAYKALLPFYEQQGIQINAERTERGAYLAREYDIVFRMADIRGVLQEALQDINDTSRQYHGYAFDANRIVQTAAGEIMREYRNMEAHPDGGEWRAELKSRLDELFNDADNIHEFVREIAATLENGGELSTYDGRTISGYLLSERGEAALQAILDEAAFTADTGVINPVLDNRENAYNIVYDTMTDWIENGRNYVTHREDMEYTVLPLDNPNTAGHTHYIRPIDNARTIPLPLDTPVYTGTLEECQAMLNELQTGSLALESVLERQKERTAQFARQRREQREQSGGVTDVAIESTEDYEETLFRTRSELLNPDVQNPDGSYGQVQETISYRFVTVDELTGQLMPLDTRVFATREEALAALNNDTTLREMNYDRIVEMATDRAGEFRDRITLAMQAAGYSRDPYADTLTYNSEGGARLQFEGGYREAYEWLNGVVFDDPEIGEAVENALHPERYIDYGSVMENTLQGYVRNYVEQQENIGLRLPDTLVETIRREMDNDFRNIGDISLAAPVWRQTFDRRIRDYEESGDKPTGDLARIAAITFHGVENYRANPDGTIAADLLFQYPGEDRANNELHRARLETVDTDFGYYQTITIEGQNGNFAYIEDEPPGESEFLRDGDNTLFFRANEYILFTQYMSRVNESQTLIDDRQESELMGTEAQNLTERHRIEIFRNLQDNVITHGISEIRDAQTEEQLERTLTRLSNAEHWAFTRNGAEVSAEQRATLQGAEAAKRQDLTQEIGTIAARYQSTQDMESGYINRIAVIREADGYRNHYFFNEQTGQGTATTGLFATLADARQDVKAHNTDAIEVQEFARESEGFTMPENQYGAMADPRLGEEYRTAEDWYIQARNGHIENPDTLDVIHDILLREAELSQDEAVKAERQEQAERVGFMAARERAEADPEIDTSLYNVEQMKIDFMDGIGGIDGAEITDGVYLSATVDRGQVLISIQDLSDPEQGDGSGASSMTLDEFKGMNQQEFDSFVGQLYSMGMEYTEPQREPERTAELEEAMQEYVVVMESGGGTRQELATFPTAEEAEQFIDDNNGVWRDENDFEWGLSLDTRDMEITIQNTLCNQIEEWVEGEDAFTLGQAQDDPTFYYVHVSNGRDIFRDYEFDHKPTHQEALDTHIDRLAAEDIDRHEAEFGADGYRAFPGNAERPLTAESFAEISGTGYEYVPGARESVYTFDCRINGEPAILTYTQGQTETFRDPTSSRGDVESTFHISATMQGDLPVDLMEAMSVSELEHLDTILSEHADFYRTNERAVQAQTISDLNEAVYAYTENENLFLTPEHREQFAATVQDKVIGLVREQIAAATTTEQLMQVRDMVQNDITGWAVDDNMREMFNREIMEKDNANKAQAARTHGEDERAGETPKDKLARQLMDGVSGVMNTEKFRSWLDTSARLFTNNYSFRNALLIFSQKPDASYCMGYEAWKEYGRNVQKGAKGAQIFVPVIAYEKQDGALFRMIKSNLDKQLKENPAVNPAVYRVGMSKMEFTLNHAGVWGLRVGGKEQTIFGNQEQVKRFIQNNVLNKVPMYFTVGNVFDVKDTATPEFLWLKKGFTKDEMARDENGKAIKNKRGEYKIVNTPERIAKFNPELSTKIVEQDPVKMAILLDALKAVAQRNGVPVVETGREADETLKGGAKGYFSRATNSITLDSALAPTEKCATLLHEMGHADLHGDLDKLAQVMGEKAPRNMREVQAESVAYATAQQFGIQTDTSSFNYIAAWSNGTQLQDLEKSLEVIFNETKKLTREIGAELDVRGLNLDLSEKPKSPLLEETKKDLAAAYMTRAIAAEEKNGEILFDIPKTAEQHLGNRGILENLAQQKGVAEEQKAAINEVKGLCDKLMQSTERREQDAIIGQLDAGMKRVETAGEKIETLSAGFMTLCMEQSNGRYADFTQNPQEAVAALKEAYPEQFKGLSSVQLDYIANSDYIKSKLTTLLDKDPTGKQFAEAVTARAAAVEQVAAKNGSFVEINFCEQWTEKPIVMGGALLHPNVANAIVKQAEAEIMKLSRQAEQRGDYFPYSKCNLTVFTLNENKKLDAYHTRCDIGDGTQKSLSDFLHSETGSKESPICTAFDKAIRERGAKEKFAFNEIPADAPIQDISKDVQKAAEDKPEKAEDKTVTLEEAMKRVDEEKAQSGGKEEATQTQEKQKHSKDRAD